MSGRHHALVGRSRELAVLDDTLARAISGQEALVLASGEPGIGKTRLLEELAARAVAAGAVVVWGRTWELGAAPAFWPWIEALRRLPGDAAAEAARILTGSVAADPAERFAVFDGVATALRLAAAVRPVVLLLDDLHAADPSSLQLLELVVRQRPPCLLIAATFRENEARLSPDVAAVLGRLGRLGTTLALQPLDREGVATMARAGGDIDDVAIDRLHAGSDGNPLFVLELLASPPTPGAHDGVPSGIRAALAGRLHRLSPPALRAASAAAIIGRDVEAAIVAETLELPMAVAGAQLSEIVRIGLMVDRGGDRFRFSHALVAEALIAELDAPARAALHLAVAQAVQRRHGGDPLPPHSVIAHHLLEAGHLAAPLAVDAATRAAESAMAQLAFEDAAGLLERALAKLTVADPAAAPRRAELQCRLGEAFHRAGMHDRGRAACACAAELARALRASDLLARAALAQGIETQLGVVDPAQVALLEEALAAQPPEDSALRALLLARLASAQQPASDPRPPIELARQAIAMVQREGDRRAQLRVLDSAGGAFGRGPVSAEERIATDLRIVALASEPADRWQALRARMRLCFGYLELGDRPMMDDAIAAYGVQAAAFRPPRAPWIERMLGAMVALIDGRFADDARLSAEADALEAEHGDSGGGFRRMFSLHRMFAAATRDDGAAAAAYAGNFIEAKTLTNAAFRLVVQAYAAALRGDRDATRAAITQLSDDQIRLACFDWAWACMLAAPIAVAGDARRAGLLRTMLESGAGRVCTVRALSFAIVDLVDRALMLLAACLGDHDAVDGHAEAALHLASRLGARPWLVLIRRDWADALAARGDLSRAAVVRAAAEPEAARLGMRARAPAEGEPPPQSPPPLPVGHAAPVVSLVAEGDFWTVTGFGETAHLKNSRGMQMLARLLAEPEREMHVLDLSGAGADSPDGGDAGEVLDDQARASYRERLQELAREIDESEACGDPGRRERAQREADALRDELTRAIGLGGRARRTGSAAERARSNVQRRLRGTLEHIETACPRLGRHLTLSVRTGTFCAYEPRR